MNSTTINCTLFVVITYLLTCILAWSLSWSLPTEYLGYSGPLAMLIPGSVAISLTIYNKEKVRDLFKLSSLKNCLFGFIMPMIAVLILYGFLSIYYGFTLEKTENVSIPMILLGFLMTFIMLIIISLGEEIGWRSYLLKNLKSQIPNFYMRAIVVGLIWGIWHIPIYMINSSVIWKDGFTLPIACSFILCMCTSSILLTWLFEKDNSVWPVNIAHATYGLMLFVVMAYTTYYPASTSDGVIGNILVAIGYFLVAIGVIWFDKARGRHLSDS